MKALAENNAPPYVASLGRRIAEFSPTTGMQPHEVMNALDIGADTPDFVAALEASGMGLRQKNIFDMLVAPK